MLKHYKGKNGKRRLLEAFGNQELVRHNDEVARRLSEVAKLSFYPAGSEVYVQGSPGQNNLYLLLMGSVELLINRNSVVVFTPGEAMGEFPILEPALAHAVTLRAREPSILAVLRERDLLALTDEYPVLWRNMARTLVRRLHRTNAMLVPERKPCVFIGHGHSDAWLRVHAFIQNDLQLDTVAFESQSRVGESIAEVLKRMRDQATFAVLVLTAEDQTNDGTVRARQNVLHETGYFQGSLGFHRAVMLLEDGVEQFSNVAGIQYIPFTRHNFDPALAALRSVLLREDHLLP